MSDRIVVSTRKGLFFVTRRGAGDWAIGAPSFLGVNATLALPDARDGTLYAALDHGHFGVKLHRSDDGGTKWEEIAAPAYPEPPAENGDDVPWKLNLIWALEGGGPDRPGVLWAGTIPGGLFRSEDRGASWSLVRSLWDLPERREWFGGGMDQPGIHSILVDPRDSRRVTLGVSCGGVWVTEDEGTTWTCRADGMRAEYLPPEQAGAPNIQDPHQIVRCPAAPDVLWCQHHNGVFRSTDDAASWTEIEDVPPSHFGFAVAVHPIEPDTAWFVPGVKDECRLPVDGRVVVARTRDGGKSFDVLARGLPGPHAYDLVFRHALAIDETGDRLAFGSTTGSLWITEDQGDTWHTVSNHLPPVHAVRFA